MKIKDNHQERESYVNASAQKRNELAVQYEPLVNKIVAQFHKKVKYDWDAIKSLGYEGLVLAFNSYDPKRSKLDFAQYAAYAIRHNILTGFATELHTVTMTNYGAHKAYRNGDNTFTSVSMSVITGDGGSEQSASRESRYGLYEADKTDGDAIAILVDTVRSNFNERICNMFFACYGLAGYEETKMKDLAQAYGTTVGYISQTMKKVINFIKNDDVLCELLASLLEP